MQLLKRYFDPTPIVGGNGEPTLTDLQNPDFKQNQDAAETQRIANEAAAKALADQTAATEYTALLAEAKNPDGTLKEGYIINNDGKVQKAAAPADDNKTDDKPAGEGDDTADEGGVSTDEFYKEVDKLHGFEIPVEYPNDADGNPIDPNSAQGVYLRDKALIQMAQDNFEQTIATKTPRGYAYLLHIQAGGDDESFFSNKSFSLPEYEVFKESAELQKSIYKSSLTTRGVDDDVADAAVEKAIKNNKLFEMADKAYQSTKSSHQKELDDITRKNNEAKELETRAITKYTTELKTAINDGKLMQFTVPDTDKAAFNQFVIDHTQIENGKFLIIRPVENLATQLESLWYEFKKGDLKALIKREAQSQNVRKLKTVIDKSKDGKGTGGDGNGQHNKQTDGFVSLGSLTQ